MDIKNLSPQILLVVALLLFGVGFAIYQGVQAFSDQKESPAYQRTPSGGFYKPAPQTIIPTTSLDDVLNGTKTDGFRPSDDALIAAVVGAERAAEAIEEGTLETYLQKKGYDISAADALEIEETYQLLVGDNQIAEGEFSVALSENSWSRLAIESSASWQTGPEFDETLPIPEIIVSWSEENGEWIISDFSFSQ